MFIVDASLGVAKYVHLAVCITIWVGLGPIKSSGYENGLYVCDVSCVAAEYNALLDPIQLGQQCIQPNEHILPHQEKCPQ